MGHISDRVLVSALLSKLGRVETHETQLIVLLFSSSNKHIALRFRTVAYTVQIFPSAEK